jgi:dinuclear metal center YbgI/SA1388 family protein
VNSVSLEELAGYLDELLDVANTPDYPQAINGLQLENGGTVSHIAAAVDFSAPVVADAAEAGADLLLVHHGMFWSGVEPVTGTRYTRMRRLIERDLAVYAAHLPLDRHAQFGNAVLLARELGLTPRGEFARFKTIFVGVRGEDVVATAELFGRAQEFAAQRGGEARMSPTASDRRTRKWAICTGAGANAETLAEAAAAGIDTLVVGEGPHWTAVAAAEKDLAIIYAGHYATETLGVRALAQHVAEKFGVRWSFLEHPTGL